MSRRKDDQFKDILSEAVNATIHQHFSMIEKPEEEEQSDDQFEDPEEEQAKENPAATNHAWEENGGSVSNGFLRVGQRGKMADFEKAWYVHNKNMGMDTHLVNSKKGEQVRWLDVCYSAPIRAWRKAPGCKYHLEIRGVDAYNCEIISMDLNHTCAPGAAKRQRKVSTKKLAGGAEEETTPAVAEPSTEELNSTGPTVVSGTAALQSHAVRIPPHADLVPSLLDAAKQAMKASKAQSAFVMTCVGSLSEVTLRMATKTTNPPVETTPNNNQEAGGEIEIAASPPPPVKRKRGRPRKDEQRPANALPTAKNSMKVKTLKRNFEIVSLVGTFSGDGGKHLHMSVSNADGQVLGGHLISGTVFTTVELVMGTIPGVAFTREMDAQTGFQELRVKPDESPGKKKRSKKAALSSSGSSDLSGEQVLRVSV